MKVQGLGLGCAIAALWAVASVAGAANLDGVHREAMVTGCVNAFATMPPVPPAMAARIVALKYRDDPARLKAFCTCQIETSYSKVEQGDYQQFLKEARAGQPNGAAAGRVNAAVKSMAPVADRACDEKLGGGK